MTTDPNVIQLNQLYEYYSNQKVTPFKMTLTVLQNDAERKFVDDYNKAFPATPTTTTSQGGLYGSGGLTGSLFNNPVSGTSSLFGSNALFGSLTSTSGSQKQLLPTGARAVSDPDKMDIDVFFFRGLEMREKYQSDRQDALLKELDDTEVLIETAIAQIQNEILDKTDALKVRSLKLNQRVITVLAAIGIIDEDSLDKLKGFCLKVENSAIEKSILEVLSVLRAKPIGNSAEGITDAEIIEVTKIIESEQREILELGNKVKELKGKFEQLRLKYAKLGK
uniref:Uncharacterized protein n=1 Tax=Entamoeba invadens TaxID=33085 RepID=S0B4X7_ENTIV|nr:hypothetical protein [Entamoeba invadens]